METLQAQPSLIKALNVLKWTFGIVPVVAGADKFTHLLTHWEKYLNPAMASLLPFPSSLFMMIVGVIEIIAGIIVLIKAEIGGYIVAAWNASIALSLLAGFIYRNVAVRDLVMAISAFTMARLYRIIA